MKRLTGLLLMVAALALPARADNASIDYSDLWWNPAHGGWGLSLQRQGAVMFATLFVYAADGTATWLFASDVRPVGDETAWSGKLYRATGPFHGAAFAASAVSISEAGTLRVDFASATAGTLTYVADGATVTEPIRRITLDVPPFAGSYNGGGMSVATLQCNDLPQDGSVEIFGPATVTASGGRVTIAFTSAGLAGAPSNCSFTGDYSQDGRMGRMSGTYRCSIFTGSDDRGENPRSVVRLGTFTFERIAVSSSGFAGKLVARDQDCTLDGRMGAVRMP